MAGRATAPVPKWWIVKGGHREGPYDQANVIIWLEEGVVAPSTIAVPDGGSQQKPLSEWPEFAEVVARLATTQPLASASAPPPAAASSSAPPSRPTLSAKQLREAIVSCVLRESQEPSLPDVPSIADFRRVHHELTAGAQSARERAQQVTAAISAYSPLEKALEQKKKELATAEVDLGKMAQSLGTAAFNAFLAGKVGQLPVFAERVDLHRKIADLESEKLSLTPPENAGMVQKAKAKAQQMVVFGKIKLAAMSEGSLETAIGKNLIHNNQEETVRCDSTNSILDAICKRRSVIAGRRVHVSEAQTALETKRTELCQSLGLAKIESASTLDAELRKCQAVIQQKDRARTDLEQGLPDKLLAETNMPQQGQLAELLSDLRQAQASHTDDCGQRRPTTPSASSLFPPGSFNQLISPSSAFSLRRTAPLAITMLGLGWGFGYMAPARVFLPTAMSSVPILLLAIPSCALAVLAALYFVRPTNRAPVPITRCALALLFTMTAGIVFLELFAMLASIEYHSHGTHTGGWVRLYEGVVKFIGWCREVAFDQAPHNLAVRFIAFIFGVGLCEELTKLLPLFYFGLKREDSASGRSMTFRGFLIIGFFSGLGFGIGEAFSCYSPWFNTAETPWQLLGFCSAGTNICRWYACVPSHAVYGMIDAAVLWYLLPTIRATANGHGRIALCAGAAGIVAVVHGVYDVVCNVDYMGPFMEMLSLGLLSWLLQVVARLRDEGDAAQVDGLGGWLGRLDSQKKYFRYLYVGSLLLIIVALFFSWSREDVQKLLSVDSSGESTSSQTPEWGPKPRNSSRPATPDELREMERVPKQAVDETWERKNGDQAKEIASKTVQLLLDGKIAEGNAKFDELVMFIGERQLGDIVLREAVSTAAMAAEATKPPPSSFRLPRRVMSSISNDEKKRAARQLIEAALAEASTLSESRYRADAYGRIAEAQAELGEIEAAIATARQMKSLAAYTMTASGAYCEIVRAQAKVGNFSGAKTTAADLDSKDKAWAYQYIAKAQAKAGDVSGAMATAAQISDEENRKAWAYCEIAEAQANAGDIGGATATTGKISLTDESSRDLCSEAIARAQIRAGDLAGAQRKDDLLKYLPLTCGVVAEAYVKAGDLAGAKKIAAEVEGEYHRVEVYCVIAETQVKLGDLAGAKATATQLEGEHVAVAFQRIAIVQAEAGDIPGAKVTAAQSGSDTYCRIALLQVEGGDLSGADATAALIGNDALPNKMAACIGIAAAQAKRGELAGADKILSWPRWRHRKSAIGTRRRRLAVKSPRPKRRLAMLWERGRRRHRLLFCTRIWFSTKRWQITWQRAVPPVWRRRRQREIQRGRLSSSPALPGIKKKGVNGLLGPPYFVCGLGSWKEWIDLIRMDG